MPPVFWVVAAAPLLVPVVSLLATAFASFCGNSEVEPSLRISDSWPSLMTNGLLIKLSSLKGSSHRMPYSPTGAADYVVSGAAFPFFFGIFLGEMS